jgi:hypothetical protein
MMPVALIQDGVVTLVALAAAAMILRRVAGSMRKTASPKCSNCASGCEPSAGEQRASDAAPTTHPLVVVRGHTRPNS